MTMMNRHDFQLIRGLRARIDELQEEVRQLKASPPAQAVRRLTPGIAEAGRRVFGLTPMQSEVLFYIASVPGAMVVSIATTIYGQYTPGHASSIQVTVCLLRKIMARQGIVILRGGGSGYDLGDSDRAWLMQVFMPAKRRAAG